MIDTYINHPFELHPKIYKLSHYDTLFIDSFSYTGNIRLCIYDLTQFIKIGKFCSIANDVEFTLVQDHSMSTISTYPFENIFDIESVKDFNVSHVKSNINIGHDVWIGRGAKIMTGVSISNGAIIGANCQVSKNVPPYAKVIGNPMKIIGYRFNQFEVDLLENLKWWDFDINKLGKCLNELYSGNVELFSSKLRDIK